MAIFLSDIGDSAELRQFIRQTDIHNSSIPLVLDQPRTVRVMRKRSGKRELTIRCHDIESRATVILFLPFEEGARASAHVIDHTESSGA